MGYESGDINVNGQTRTYMLMQNDKHSFDEVTDKLGMMLSANRSHSIEPVDYDLNGKLIHEPLFDDLPHCFPARTHI